MARLRRTPNAASRSRVLVGALALSALLGALAPAARAGTPSRGELHALLVSRVLWSTIDVCSPSDQPNTVGIRGSMPGDGRARDRMYMSFRLQYLDRTTMRWSDLAGTAPAFVPVGDGASSRQGGRSFQLVPVAGSPAFQLRGVVEFQWRRGRTVLQAATRTTSAGHRALAGADPAGFSSASCPLG